MPGLGGVLVNTPPPGWVAPANWSNNGQYNITNVTDTSQLLLEPTGTLARTIPRALVTSGTLAAFNTTGQVAATGVILPAGMVITNVATIAGNTAVVGQTQFWTGITDASLNVLAVTAGQGAAAVGANALLKIALAAQLTILTTGLYYVVAASTAATTAPTATGSAMATGIATNLGAPVICGTAGTQSAPPAVGAQLAAGVVTGSNVGNIGYWLS
jgi:hypothetical protein